MELHVWGTGRDISLIDPECLASAWLLNAYSQVFKIVTSNNTNLSPTNKLPVLITATGEKFSGYYSIYNYINPTPDLVELALISYIEEKFGPINQYNLFIKSDNYEQYTRKLFQNYFPFPMMYNQPLKFYYNAQEAVQTIGLNSDSPGFFNLSGNKTNIAETETVNADTQEEVAISSLHEKQLIVKSKQKKSLVESRYSLKCLNLIEQYLTKIQNTRKENSRGKRNTSDGTEKSAKSAEKNIQSTASEFKAANILLVAYINALTFEDLPDKFIQNYLHLQFPSYTKELLGERDRLNNDLKKITFSVPKSSEVPNLWNEILLVAKPLIG